MYGVWGEAIGPTFAAQEDAAQYARDHATYGYVVSIAGDDEDGWQAYRRTPVAK